MIYLVLAVLFLHISVLPIIIGAFVDIDSDKRFVALKIALFGIPLFAKRMSFDEIEENVKSKRKLKAQAEKTQKTVKSHSAKRLIIFGKNLLSRIRVRNMCIEAEIGLSDAAACACTCAAVDIAYAQACAFCGIPYKRQNIKADYNNDRLCANIDGIISLCFADIICAACSVIGVRDKTRSLHENNDNITRGIQRASD